jgi:hypothetical protein
MIYHRKFDTFIRHYDDESFTIFSLLNDGYNCVNDAAYLSIRKMTGGGQDKVFVRRKDFVGADEAVDRKPAGTETGGGERNSQRIGFVFTGNLADNTIIAVQISQNQGRTALAAG